MTIPKRFENLKYYIKAEYKINQEMEKIQDRLNNIEWTEETYLERIRLYQQLGKLIDRYRIDRINKKWYYERLLKNANLTG